MFDIGSESLASGESFSRRVGRGATARARVKSGVADHRLRAANFKQHRSHISKTAAPSNKRARAPPVDGFLQKAVEKTQ
ncbi:hypothetical protein BURKHO8Y_210085 [Burkholderia sp. 8Y]|nr:hypothetical protein BURKHO8Y_210085 [Burkholderia sp. 8Y]